MAEADGAPQSPGLDGSPAGSDAASRAKRRVTPKTTSYADALLEEAGEENVNVCVRVRPFNSRELELQRTSTDKTGALRSVVAMPEGMAGRVVFYEKQQNSSEYRQCDEFQYTKTFWSVPEEQQPHTFAPVSQEDVYEAIGRPIIRFAFAGFHNCVFAYGQTGSGKTHTMMGDFDGSITASSGLIPRLCVELFEKVNAARNAKEEGIIKTVDVKLSAIEIYNEQVRDLLWKLTPGRTKQQQLKIRKHPVDGSFFVDQLTIVSPSSWLECLKFIDKAVAERTVAATDMNDESSRSHCIFQIVLEQSETVHVQSDDPDERFTKPVTNKKMSKINLVDLAGSERLKKSNAQGQQLKEAAGINLSLTTLKKVIDALVVNSKELNPKKHVLIPFRESSLTLLLSDSLGGNSKTTMVACVSPHYDNQEETLLTLRYANRTGTIVNHARINEDSAAKQALRLKHEILELQRRLAEGPVDEEAEELQDQIEIGRRSLKEMETYNAKVSRAADELRQKSKMEEEAILSSAFYNSMKMALLQQQRAQMEQNASDMEQRIRQNMEEAAKLMESIAEKEKEEKVQTKQLERLRKEAHAQRMKEAEQERQNGKLSREAEELHRKMEKEIMLRYAQKMLNAYRLKKEKMRCQAELDALIQEQEDKLTDVISEAAQQYELQVRQFADAETIVHQRTTRIEKEIHSFNKKREECEAEASQLMIKIRTAERAHVERIQSIEKDWKAKYEALKESYEERIAAQEKAYFDAEKERELRFANMSKTMHVGQEDVILELENRVREAELAWNRRTAQLVEDKADEMEAMMRAQVEVHAIAAAKKRKVYEMRIGELVAEYNRIVALEAEVTECIEGVERAIAPLMHDHDAISTIGHSHSGSRDSWSASAIARACAGYSREYIALKQRLLRFDGTISSVKPQLPSVLQQRSITTATSSVGVGTPKSPARRNGTCATNTSSSSSSLHKSPFPVTPVHRVKLSKASYADAAASLAAAMEQSMRGTSAAAGVADDDNGRSSSPVHLMRKRSSLSRGLFTDPSAGSQSPNHRSPTLTQRRSFVAVPNN